ncbi:hypothetical protein AVEN_140754-1 [Araneus ventricosus]|uniref:Uncharacterized protein n=1 Tax=Araneus ventricosus TaxID=182803 RepID=A0A4Y2F516_ARAVE|nr:hypothetical protein AVEN_140754-1 [Araneus ventricosus]
MLNRPRLVCRFMVQGPSIITVIYQHNQLHRCGLPHVQRTSVVEPSIITVIYQHNQLYRCRTAACSTDLDWFVYGKGPSTTTVIYQQQSTATGCPDCRMSQQT